MTTARLLTRYKAWADALFWATVAQLPAADRLAPQPILFGSLMRTLHHAYAMDRVWPAHLLGQPHGYTTRNPTDHPPFAELHDRQLEIDAWYVAYAESLDEQALAEVVRFAFIGGGDGAMSRNEILLHVVNHGTYHRGHVADMLYHHQVVPPTTDLPVFLAQQRAC